MSAVFEDTNTATTSSELSPIIASLNTPPQPLVANIGGPYEGNEGTTFTLDGTASTDNGTIVSYIWDLDNDGSFDDATGATPNITFQDNGAYPISLRVIDNDELSATDTTTVTVSNQAPTVNAGANQEVNPNGTVTIDTTFSDIGTLDTHTATINWGDGITETGTVDETNGSGSVAGVHNYLDPAVYIVEVCVTDDDGDVGCDTLTITVSALPNAPPDANAGGPYSNDEGSVVTLDGTGSSDTDDGTIVSYEWDLDNDGEYDDASGITATVTFDDNGTYIIGLRIMDDEGAIATAVADITIANLAPTLVAGAQQTVAITQLVTVSASYVDAGSLDTHTATIEWGDGTSEAGIISGSNGTGNVAGTHQYVNEGTYTVAIELCDNGNACASDSLSVVVNAGHDASLAVTPQTASALSGSDSWLAISSPFKDDENHNNYTIYEYSTSQDGPWETVCGNGIAGGSLWRHCSFGGELTADTDYFVRVTFIDPDGVNGNPSQVLGPIRTAAEAKDKTVVSDMSVTVKETHLLVSVPITGDSNRNSRLERVEVATTADGPWQEKCGPFASANPKLCRIHGLTNNAEYWVRATVSDVDGVEGMNPQIVGPLHYTGSTNLAPGKTITADAGWGCCSDPNQLLDGRIQHPDWTYGLAWTGGTGNWAGGSPGWKHALIDLGTIQKVSRVDWWTHDAGNVPSTWKISVSSDGTSFSEVFLSEEPQCRAATEPLLVNWAFPSCGHSAQFEPVDTRFIRYEFDDQTLFDGIHGWAVEIEVFGPQTVELPVPEITVPSAIPTYYGQLVTVPVEFSGNGNDVAATTFSIEFDENCLSLNTDDNDGDGLPDAVKFLLPGDFGTSVEIDLNDIDGELDFTIADVLTPLTALADGKLATIEFQTDNQSCQPKDGSSRITSVSFANEPMASFGNTEGSSIPGKTIDGSIEILAGLRGDCNSDGKVDAGDISACVLEIFDGDGSLPQTAAEGDFAGSSFGCDSNGDGKIDAGDIVCTVLTIFNGPEACGRATTAAELQRTNMVQLGIPTQAAKQSDGRIAVPITFNSGGQDVSAVVLALDIDTSLMAFNSDDSDGDGIPDDVIVHVPDSFTPSISYSQAAGQLQVMVADLSSPLEQLSDGPLLTIHLSEKEPTEADSLPVPMTFDSDMVSAGASNGQSIPVQIVHGTSIRFRQYIPLMTK
ncbi:MAG: PKD domain-containing protein [Chloroflexota bacterium]